MFGNPQKKKEEPDHETGEVAGTAGLVRWQAPPTRHCGETMDAAGPDRASGPATAPVLGLVGFLARCRLWWSSPSSEVPDAGVVCTGAREMMDNGTNQEEEACSSFLQVHLHPHLNRVFQKVSAKCMHSHSPAPEFNCRAT